MRIKSLTGREWVFSLNQEERSQLVTTFLKNGKLVPM